VKLKLSEQTRRSFSVKGVTYQRLVQHCEKHGISISAFMETLIHERMDDVGQPRVPSRELRRRRQPRPLSIPKIGSGIVEF
jgi:hypothetical protein